MRKTYILLVVLSTLLFSKIIVGKNIDQFSINNQFNKMYNISEETKKIIFIFTKNNMELVNTFLNTKDDNYLTNKNILFVLDISKISSLSKWFLLDELNNYNYSVLLIDDMKISTKYREDSRNDKIMMISLSQMKVIGIDYTENIDELQNLIENN